MLWEYALRRLGCLRILCVDEEFLTLSIAGRKGGLRCGRQWEGRQSRIWHVDRRSGSVVPRLYPERVPVVPKSRHQGAADAQSGFRSVRDCHHLAPRERCSVLWVDIHSSACWYSSKGKPSPVMPLGTLYMYIMHVCKNVNCISRNSAP